MTQKITPHLWFDTQAVEAAQFYVETFGSNSAIRGVTRLRDTPSGDCDVVRFELLGFEFMAISAGPLFRINPTISFHVRCATVAEVDAIWARLTPGGKVMMPLDSYPFSARYGWVEDRYGVSWQIILADGMSTDQRIVPALMFVGGVAGKAEEAARLYASLFDDSSVTILARYEAGEGPDAEGTVRYGEMVLAGQQFGVMDSALAHEFAFNEGISLSVACDNQAEMDRLTDALSAVPEAEQCGWIKDRFGVSWQIVPRLMETVMSGDDQARVDRVVKAFLPMKRLNLAELESAAAG